MSSLSALNPSSLPSNEALGAQPPSAQPQDMPAPGGVMGLSAGSADSSGNNGGDSLVDWFHSIISHIAAAFHGGGSTASPSGPSGADSNQPAGGIFDYEAYNNGSDEHAKAVANVLKNGTQQDNPSITTQYMPATNPAQTALVSQYENGQIDSQSFLNGLVDNSSTDILNNVSGQLNTLASDPNNTQRVVNISAGESRVDIYHQVAQLAYDDPKMAQALGVDSSKLFPSQVDKNGNVVLDQNGKPVKNPDYDPANLQKIVDFVNQRMDAPDSAYQTALQNYQASTQNAANKGITAVISTHNAQQLADTYTNQFQNVPPGVGFNFLCMSNSVISVAAANDDHDSKAGSGPIANFSSHGTGEFNPTVSANGTDVSATDDPKEDNGTSFSAPEVAALVHEMLLKNPNLTFNQIEQQLQQGATPINAPADETGAGEITASGEKQILANVPSPSRVA